MGIVSKRPAHRLSDEEFGVTGSQRAELGKAFSVCLCFKGQLVCERAANDPLILTRDPLIHDGYALGVCLHEAPDERVEGIDTVPPGFVGNEKFCRLTDKGRTD